jgi:peptidoglycan/xylan/chitin deacetylase (PgdA/CDA1 family)
MRLPGRKGIVRAGRWLRSRFRARALILGYHRVGTPASDPFGLAVSEAALRDHLSAVRRVARPIGLRDMVHALREGAPPPNAVAITFDDADAETLSILPRVLEAYDVPATIFVPTQCIGREPWWERLHRVLAGAGGLPARLELRSEGVEVGFELGGSERLERASPGSRDVLVRGVYDAVCRLPGAARETLLAQVEAWADSSGHGIDGSRARSVASSAQLVEIGTHGLIDLGSHSDTHPFLAELPESRQTEEAVSSKRRLEQLLGRQVDLFSYPNGSWSRSSGMLVRAAGYQGACASQPDVVTRRADPFRLPRHWPADDGGCVARTLGTWLTR